MKTINNTVILSLLLACISSTLVQANQEADITTQALQQTIDTRFLLFQKIQDREIRENQARKTRENYAKVCLDLVPYNRARPDQKILLEDLPEELQQEILFFICPTKAKFLQKDIKAYCKAKELSQIPTLSFEYIANTKEPKKIPLLPLQSNFYRYIERSPKKICEEKIYNNIEQLIALDSIDLFSDLLLIDCPSKRFHPGQYKAGDYLRATALVKKLSPNIRQKLEPCMNACSKEGLRRAHTYYLYHFNNTRKSSMRLIYANLSKNNT